MRIVVANFIADPVLGGGTAMKSVTLARALASAGVGAHLITTNLGLSDNSSVDVGGANITVVPAVFPRFPIPWVRRGELAAGIKGADAVILLNHWNILNARVFLAARRVNVPVMLCPAGALRIQGRSRWLKEVYQALIGQRMIDQADALIATTPVEEAEFRAAGISPARIHVIPNGIDTEPEGMTGDEFRTRHGLGSAPLVLFMGRLNSIKGPDLLLEAFVTLKDRLPTWHLVIAGRDEGLERSLRARAGHAGLAARVHFVGHLDPAASTGAYRSASLLVVPSRHEAMSLVALEAAVNGTPVLLTDVCGFSGVEESGGGRVVAATVSAISRGLEKMLADPNLPVMGARLREYVVAKFGWGTVVQQYIQLVTWSRSDNRS